MFFFCQRGYKNQQRSTSVTEVTRQSDWMDTIKVLPLSHRSTRQMDCMDTFKVLPFIRLYVGPSVHPQRSGWIRSGSYRSMFFHYHTGPQNSWTGQLRSKIFHCHIDPRGRRNRMDMIKVLPLSHMSTKQLNCIDGIKALWKLPLSQRLFVVYFLNIVCHAC